MLFSVSFFSSFLPFSRLFADLIAFGVFAIFPSEFLLRLLRAFDALASCKRCAKVGPATAALYSADSKALKSQPHLGHTDTAAGTR